MDTLLRIAIQKSGRLQEGSLDLLKESGLSFSNGRDQLKTQARNFPVEVLFLRDDDIPQYVFDSVADIGIVGENVWKETNKNIDMVYRLGFGKCRLSLAVPRSMKYESVNDLRITSTSLRLLVNKVLPLLTRSQMASAKPMPGTISTDPLIS